MVIDGCRFTSIFSSRLNCLDKSLSTKECGAVIGLAPECQLVDFWYDVEYGWVFEHLCSFLISSAVFLRSLQWEVISSILWRMRA